ncbi:MAG: hypothetical protein SGILL_003511 [Bacillariaceae sp.]
MDDFDSFSDVLDRLRSKSRDPLSSRISSVTAAITDVAKDGEITTITPAKVYASAVTTLEGTLQREDIVDDDDALLDTLYTQAALLKILTAVVPHVAPSTLHATMGLTSRVLRAVVASTLSLFHVDGNTDGSGTSAPILDTKDGLGATNTILMNACATVGEVLRQLPVTTEETVVRQLLNGTLMSLLQDSSRPKVQTAAKDALAGLLMQSCHPTILQSTTKYTNAMIDRFQKQQQSSSSSHQQSSSQTMIELMGFLNPTLVALDFTTIGSRIMTILVDLLNLEAASFTSHVTFVTTKSHASTLRVLTINGILSTILSLLENTRDDEFADADSTKNTRMDFESKLDSFAARVLASLVQAKSTLVFREGAADIDLLESGRLMHGQVMLSASQRLLRSSTIGNVEIGAKLLPLVLQQLLGLSRPIAQDETESSVGQTLFVELSQLFRMEFSQLKETHGTIHERASDECLRVLKTALDSPFDESCGPILPPLALLVQQMNVEESAVAECMNEMVELRCSLALREAPRKLIDSALTSIVEGVGLESFWRAINFTMRVTPGKKKAIPNNKYPWIFDVMKASAIGNSLSHLAFFQAEVLPLARKFDALSAQVEASKSAVFRTRVIDLWGLFPVFCRNPADVSGAFENLTPILVKAIFDTRYPELLTIICDGLDVLFRGVIERKNALEELVGEDEARSVREEAETLSRMSVKILPSLFKVVDSLHEAKAQTMDGDDMAIDSVNQKVDSPRVFAATQVIASVARLAPKPQIQTLFSKLLQRILQALQSEDKEVVEKICSLLTLAQALIVSECLEESSVDLLYRALKPLIRTDETHPKIQKRAYKLLCELCKRHHDFITKPDRLEDVLHLLSTTSATSQISARFMRLKCLAHIVEGLKDSPKALRQDIAKSLAGETLLCLKDSNAKTREAALTLLVAMTNIYDEPSEYMQVIAAGIASETPHMRSASVTALTRLAFEFSSNDPAIHSMLPSLLKTVLVLSDDPCREVTKSMVGFVRVSVSAASKEQLQPLLQEILSGLLSYHRGKDRFRAKIKIIIKKLVKLFGYDALMPFVPESDTRLLTHMRKLSERETRRKLSGYQLKERDVNFEAMIESDGEDDSDDGLTLMTGMTRKSRLSRVTSRSGKQTLKRKDIDAKTVAMSYRSARQQVSVRIKNDADGNVLDVKELKSVRFAESDSDDDDSDAEMVFDASGKLVVRDLEDEDVFSTSGNHEGQDTLLSLKGKRLMAKGSPKHPHAADSRRKQSNKTLARPGQAYKAKKAGGDTKTKAQKYEPYAYVQLDGRNYSRKNRRQAVEQMGSVVHRGNKRRKR